MGNLEKCLEDTSHAISLDPELGRAYRAHGNCSLEIGDFDQAVADLEKSVLYEADNSDAWYTLGIVYYKSGKLLESLDANDKALALDPDYHQALINRGVSLSGLERHLEAIDDFSRALSFGDIFLTYRARGDAYLAIGMYENARKDFESAIEIFPYQSYPYCRLAVTYLELDRYEDALAQVANAAEYDPACTESQQLLDVQARSYFARGDYLSAIQFMNRALEIGLYSEGYYYRGIAHQAAGHVSEAISDLGRFVSSAESLGYVGEEVADAERRLENLASEPKSKPTPAALAYATPISYTNKMPITISGGTSVALKLLPVPRIPSIDFVNELSFYFEVSGTGQSTLDFSLWSPSSGGWGINQGNNKIPRGESIIPINIPDPYVNRNGDIYISIRNYGSIPIEITEIYVVIEVLTVDGEIVQHGALY